MPNGTPAPTFVDLRQESDGWIKKYVLTYAMPDGSTYEYESASRKSLEAYRRELEGNAAGKKPPADAVCIVPQTPDGQLLLIREFRYPLNSWCIAFPAGLVDPGEDLASCVDRELREETGFALRADLGSAAGLLVHRPYRRDGSRGVRTGGARRRRAARAGRVHRAVPAVHKRRPPFPCRERHAHRHARPAGAGGVRAPALASTVLSPTSAGPVPLRASLYW